jgi:hypothetical protein
VRRGVDLCRRIFHLLLQLKVMTIWPSLLVRMVVVVAEGGAAYLRGRGLVGLLHAGHVRWSLLQVGQERQVKLDLGQPSSARPTSSRLKNHDTRKSQHLHVVRVVL